MRGSFYLQNSQLKTGEFDNSLIGLSKTVYEVMRIIDGVPLFFDEHYERLIHSCEIVGKKKSVNAIDLLSQLKTLCEVNKISDGNIMVRLIFNDPTVDLLVNFIPHSYPTISDYEQGVEVGVLFAERENPEAKIINASLRERANALLAENKFYEVMLVDQSNLVTEGSRSNLVFVKKNELYTAPLFKVLKGVTLGKVLEISMKEGIGVHFENVDYRKLSSYDAMFITGTSPGVLPTYQVGNVEFSVNHPIIEKIKTAYNVLVLEDIKNRKGHL